MRNQIRSVRETDLDKLKEVGKLSLSTRRVRDSGMTNLLYPLVLLVWGFLSKRLDAHGGILQY